MANQKTTSKENWKQNEHVLETWHFFRAQHTESDDRGFGD